MLLAENSVAIANTVSDLAEKTPDAFVSLPDFESWRFRARKAHGFLEATAAGLRAYIAEAESVSAAEEACRRFAAEIERLNAEIRSLKETSAAAATSVAFVDVARMVMSEVTFTRIYERARDRAR